MFETILDLFKSFHSIPDEDKWQAPFPIGVFGTLRKGCGNDFLMGSPLGQKDKINYSSHHRAFLSHFVASGLSIHSFKDRFAPFEIYTYEKEQWLKMIPQVDALESFKPNVKKDYGYHRTLVWLSVLPEETFKWFPKEVHLWELRDLEIPSKYKDSFVKIPCWIYSSIDENELNKKIKNNSIIWY